uniref:Methyltransferase domain-containing protein n=1 Tax=Pavo cristatus TaxID=9049 RepID=A0A8C9EJ07_PAVCR
MVRIIRWLEKQKVPLDSSVLDIGTGNGVLLIELAKNGFTNLTGIDYSPSAIQLSEKVREKEGMSNIKLLVEDFLAPSAELLGFQICIDKGTFDAVSLNPDNAVGKRKQYVRSLCSVLKPEGFFLITSCNWTKEELLNEFREGEQLNRTTCQPMAEQGCRSQSRYAGKGGNSVPMWLVFSSFGLLLADAAHPHHCSKNYPCLGELASLTDRFCPLLLTFCSSLKVFLPWCCF